MKNLKLFSLLVIFGLITISCSKTSNETLESLDCIDVYYDVSFTIESNTKYCFSDGNYIETKELINEFCPCNVICVWEGQMTFKYEANFDGDTFTGVIGSHRQDFFNKQDEKYSSNISEIKLVNPCSQTDPSPAIKNATIIVSK